MRLLPLFLVFFSVSAHAYLPNCKEWWSTNHKPAATAQATITKTVAANRTLVIDCAIGVFAGAAAANTPIYMQLLDASDSDAVLLPVPAGGPANGMGGFGMCGIGHRMVIGHNAKLAFSAAGTTDTPQTVYLSGCIE